MTLERSQPRQENEPANLEAPFFAKNFKRLMRSLAVALLATTFSYSARESAAQTESLPNPEHDRIAEIAKIPLFIPLGNESYTMGHGGLAIERVSAPDGAQDVLKLCTISHVAFPREFRQPNYQPEPSTDAARPSYSPEQAIVMTGLRSGTSLQEAFFRFPASLMEQRSDPDQSLNQDHNVDPAVCKDISEGVATIIEEKTLLAPSDFPRIRPERELTIDEEVFAFDRDGNIHYYSILEVTNNGHFSLSAPDLEAQAALDRGDSGSPFFVAEADGTIVMVGVYSGREIIPSLSGGVIEFLGARIGATNIPLER